jgi:hypothetical protein
MRKRSSHSFWLLRLVRPRDLLGGRGGGLLLDSLDALGLRCIVKTVVRSSRGRSKGRASRGLLAASLVGSPLGVSSGVSVTQPR